MVGRNVALKGPFPLVGESELSRNLLWNFTPNFFARNTDCRSQLLECWVDCVWLAFFRFCADFSVCHVSLAIARFAPLHPTTHQQILRLSFFLSRRRDCGAACADSQTRQPSQLDSALRSTQEALLESFRGVPNSILLRKCATVSRVPLIVIYL
jgi:hypothetical protein